ncbi:tRNA:m(4)X modification enzyme TRM13-like [Miscanthus floridulus]|uniref:tRNA:m(4)X modification enzyme TRM13-like n=1 Tax=Miscanthus floridulus TaxID=154761 RepID=UPI00345A668C
MGRAPVNGKRSPPPPPPPGRCHFWLPNKRRHCANSSLPSSQYCGNHLPESASGAGRRVPCPVDPSHTVLEENLEAHVGKCPLKKQVAALTAQPYYSKGINSGAGEPGCGVTSAEKRAAVYRLTEEEFRSLLGKIRSVHAAASAAIRESYLITGACDKWMSGQVDRKVPYQEKHVAQQASIVGNMEAFGLLRKGSDEVVDGENAAVSAQAVVEFGAGRGYLTQVLVDCYGITNVFLVERRSYKLKADRSLRQNEDVTLERLRIDIEDLKLHGIEALRGLQYLAIGKHLCGPATDMTMMCCLPERYDQTEENGKHSLQGLALATCCHHLCQWKHYTNKSFLLGLGITEEEFHAMTWFSSWAVDGDHSYPDSPVEVEDTSSEVRELEKLDQEIIGIERIIRSIPAGERASLGSMCKDIIDTGRLLWLGQKGLVADLVSYVPSKISPENRLLIAKCTS